MSKERTRAQILFEPRDIEIINRLRGSFGTSSRVATLRKALALADMFMNHIEAGEEWQTLKDGKTETYVFVGLRK